MPEAQYLFLTQPHRELVAEIRNNGPLLCSNNLPIHLTIAPNLNEMINSPLRFQVAISCEYDPANPPCPIGEIMHHLREVAIALQLVKPVDEFAEYWLRFNCEQNRALLYSPNLTLPRTPDCRLPGTLRSLDRTMRYG